MTPRGASPLVAMRMSGQRPDGPAWVSYGEFMEPDWWRWAETCNRPEILVRPGDPVERLDLRCLVGLEVVLFAAEWSAPLARLYERLQDYAAEIAVMVASFGEDIGWYWIKGVGQVDCGRRHLVGHEMAGRTA